MGQELQQVQTVRTFPTTKGEPIGQNFLKRRASRDDEPERVGIDSDDDPVEDSSDDHVGRRGD